jgi:hypothetical protein
MGNALLFTTTDRKKKAVLGTTKLEIAPEKIKDPTGGPS